MKVWTPKRDRLIKPPVNAKLDYSNSLARGIVGCWVLNAGSLRDRASNLSTVISAGATPWKSPEGIYCDGADTRLTVTQRSVINQMSAISVVARVFPTGIGENANGAIAIKPWEGTGYWKFAIAPYIGNPDLQFDIDYATTNLNGESNTGLSYNVWSTVGVSWNGGTTFSTSVSFYLDGKDIGIRTGTDAVGARQDDSAGNLHLFNNQFGSRTWAGFVSYVYLYNRVLTVSEHLQLHSEPYCFFLPIKTRRYFSSGGASPQTVNAEAIAALAIVGSATTTCGAVSVTPTPSIATGIVGAATTVCGAASVTPDPAITVGIVGAAITSCGAVSVTPESPLAAGIVGTAATAVGAVSVTPTSAIADGIVGEATTSQGGASQDVTPTSAVAVGAVGTATPVCGAISTTPASAVGIAVVGDAVVGIGAQVATPVSAFAEAIVGTATTTVGAVSVTPGPAIAIGTIGTATTSIGVIDVTPTPAVAMGLAGDPTTSGSLTITVNSSVAVAVTGQFTVEWDQITIPDPALALAVAGSFSTTQSGVLQTYIELSVEYQPTVGLEIRYDNPITMEVTLD